MAQKPRAHRPRFMYRSDAGMSGNLLRASCQKHDVSQTRGGGILPNPNVFVFKITKPFQVMNDLPHVRKSTRNDMDKPVCQFRIPDCLIISVVMPKIGLPEFPVVHYVSTLDQA